MDQFGLDPYEQQLLKVFDSHDRDRLGSLDRDGLMHLCQTLQLEEQGLELVKCLLSDNKRPRATFPEFKDALLTLLGSMQNNTINRNNTNENTILENPNEKTSPEREVSPKFVYGSKKYGRRSRPKNEDLSAAARLNFNNEECNKIQRDSSAVQRSNSQTEVSSKKRRTNYKLKRCTSLPGNDACPNAFITKNFSNEPELICTEEMLREAWKSLGVGEDGYLNQAELVLVCDAIGLHKLADGVIRQLSDKLTQNNYNTNYKISFNELLDILRQDDTWFDVLNQCSNNNSAATNKNSEIQPVRSSSEALFPDSRTFQYVTLGPNGNGSINTDSLIEMWEAVGIHSPKELIHELGFNARVINVVELAEVLDSQTKNVLQENESSGDEYQSPHIVLLQANLTLYQSEIRCLKSVLEQMQAEREKLKCDVVEANNRATLLAQEVDDNHSRMEQNTINQVKLLEQRHTDLLKEVTLQYSKDKEQLNIINQSLEDKIALLETETAKLKSDLIVSQKYAINVEKENNGLTGKIGELQKDRTILTEQIGLLESEKQKSTEIERRESEILLAKLNALQLENSKLKDHNDEMASEIECLNTQVVSMKSKAQSTPTRNFNTLEQTMEENISIICEGVGLGAKRRSDYSPTKDVKLFSIADGSPRLGKLRKFHKSKCDNLEVPFTSNESGFDTEPESLSNSACDNAEELARLQAKVAFLEQILVQNKIPVPDSEESDTKESDIMQLTARVRTLEMIIEETKLQMSHTTLDTDCANCERIRNITNTLEHILSTTASGNNDTCVNEKAEKDIQTEVTILGFEETVQKLETENKELIAKCSELENCVELLRTEYEKCEDYWQTKVDEERQFFEAEQKISGEKLNEVLIKMREYEEQYANQDMLDSRLPPIVETDNLEKQFTDLEQEFEDYKSYHENEIDKRDEEIAILKEKLTELALRQRQVAEAAVQAGGEDEDIRIMEKMKGFTSYVIESTNRFSEEMEGPPQVSLSAASSHPLDFTNSWEQPSPKSETDQSTASSLPLTWNFPSQTNVQPQPNPLRTSTVPSTASSQISTPCRPKRTRRHDKNMYKKQSNQEKEVKKTECSLNNVASATQLQPDWKPGYPAFKTDQNIVIPLAAFHNLNGRKNFLEQRVRHLQLCLKQQHCHNEQTLQYYWQHFRGERTDLHSKLKFCQEKLDQQVHTCNEQLEKLHRTDMLVKDLYVENSYLFAAVERLEKQCRMLAQCNNSSHNSSSSV